METAIAIIMNSQEQKMKDALALLNHSGRRNIREMRQLILGLEAAMQAMPEYVPGEDFKTTHRFDKCIYIRECVIPEGFTVTGRIHKYEHWNFLVKGTITVWTEDGMKTLTAPAVLQSQPGIKRVGYAHDEVVWITVHSNPSDEREIKKVEGYLFADTFDEAYLTSSKTFPDAIRFLGFSSEEVTSISENESDQIRFLINSDRIRIGESEIHGSGVFAIRTIESGSVIGRARFQGKRTPIGRFCNHSGDPNAEMMMRENGDVDLIARKRIESGQEILNDYYLSFINTRPLSQARGVTSCQV